MFKKTLGKVCILAAAMLAAVSAYAQNGANTGFTPYSIFGIGDINAQGSAYHRGMGGVGIATRNNGYFNYLNPAAVTARDSLSFMADMSVSEANRYMAQGDIHSVGNTFNVTDIAISFPIYRSSAFMIGITPYSSTGYKYSYILDDPDIVGKTGNAVYTSYGSGGTNKLFAAAGVTFFKRLSLGVEGQMYFGSIFKSSSFTFAKSAYSGISTGNEIYLRGKSAKFGLQYEQPVGQKVTVGIGATYSLGVNLSGETEAYKVATGASQSDTLSFRRDTLGLTTGSVSIPAELGLGISINYSNVWRAEFNYTRSDWTQSGMDIVNGFAVAGASTFSTRMSESYRAGFEIIPNANDIRYYLKRCTYRAGFYYQKSYYAVDGNQVNDIGLTLGASLPVFRLSNAMNFAVDFGQRSSTSGNMIRERYVNFTVGFNFYDLWFRKTQYQ